jgi:hypothetical protein
MKLTTVLAVSLLVPALAAAAEPVPTIYRCRTESGITFADRPCGPDSRPYVADVSGVSIIETTAAQPSAAASHPAPKALRRTPVTDDPAAARAAKAAICGRLDQSLRRIRSTMRAGYSASQGERLRERKRELEAQHRAQRC